MRRIRCDLIFNKDTEADEVWDAMKNYLKRKDIRSLVNEPSYIDYHDCHHDIQQPCETIERFEK